MSVQPQDKYVLRMPDGLRGEIKAAAAKSGRSMNAEIVHRLSAAEQQTSLRDWFAGQAIPLAVAFHNNPANAAKWCFEYADAMIAEREKGGVA